jgi:crossover junction endodeoxyribonuclease RuvC
MITLGPRQFLGVDIGIQGAIAVLDETGALLAVEEMPVLNDGPNGRRTINAPLLADIISQNQVISAFVEHVAARAGEGPTGAFSFGRARGVIEGTLASAKIPVTFITPPSWKRAIGLPSGTNKDMSRSAAIRRWPDKAELFRRVKDDGRSDACLICLAGLLRAGILK